MIGLSYLFTLYFINTFITFTVVFEVKAIIFLANLILSFFINILIINYSIYQKIEKKKEGLSPLFKSIKISSYRSQVNPTIVCIPRLE